MFIRKKVIFKLKKSKMIACFMNPIILQHGLLWRFTLTKLSPRRAWLELKR